MTETPTLTLDQITAEIAATSAAIAWRVANVAEDGHGFQDYDLDYLLDCGGRLSDLDARRSAIMAGRITTAPTAS